MAYVKTSIPVKALKETMTGSGNLVQGIVGDILRNIPVGFAHHKTPMPCYTLEVLPGLPGAHEKGRLL